MTVVSRNPDARRFDDVARLLNQVVDAEANSGHAHDLLDEISQLLWTVSSLDPEAERLLKNSDYVGVLTTRTQG